MAHRDSTSAPFQAALAILAVLWAGCSGTPDRPVSAGSHREGPADAGSVLLDDPGPADGASADAGSDGGQGAEPSTDTGATHDVTPDPPAEPPDRTLREGMVGRVTAVIDGDTIHVTVDGWYYDIRFQGIDAPECDKVLTPTLDGQTYVCNADQEWWGLNAEIALSSRIYGKDVTVHCDGTPGQACPLDTFDRYLAFIEDGEGDVGEWMARNGHAFSFTKYPSTRRATYCAAEDAAIADGVGMWSLGDPSEVLSRMNANTQDWYADRDRLCAQALEGN